MLRTFIAGEEAGVSHSQLIIGEDVLLDGTLQIVFAPELFSEFDFTPEVGQTFDLIVAEDGITVDLETLELQNLVTTEGADQFSGLTLTEFDSGFVADPDSLFLIEETLFSLELVDNNTILRATLIEPVNVVPEPASIALLAFGGFFLNARRRKMP